MTKAPLIDEWEQRREEIRFKTPPQNHHRLFHLLHPKQFDRTFLDQMCELTTDIRTLAKTAEGQSHLQRLLAHKRAMLYFTQPSTRTFLSFVISSVLGPAKSVTPQHHPKSKERASRTVSAHSVHTWMSLLCEISRKASQSALRR